MSDVKQDVKESVKVFTQTFVSTVVKESTKKLIKNLTQRDKKLLETRVKNMSDAQLERYFINDPYFKNALKNTINSINITSPEKGTESLLNKVQEIYEATYVKNLMKILIWPAPNVIIASLVIIALLLTVAIPIAISGSNTINTELPLANFSSNASSGYPPFSVQFKDQSQDATEWNWNFGDGNNSNEQNPEHTYYTAGNYTVNLTTINKDGADSKTTLITVFGQTAMPVANFSSDVTSGYVPLKVRFTDQSENAEAWNWDFEDGNNSTERNPVHTYSSAGNYTVNLTVTNEKGTDSKIAIIMVSKQEMPSLGGVPVLPLPVADFSINVSSGYAPLSIRFTDTSKNTDGRIWDFGDGNNSTEQNPEHTYSATGNYTVNLTATNENGKSSKLATIIVLDQGNLEPLIPVANFSVNVANGYAPLTVKFTDQSEYVTGWSWSFGDGDTSTEQNPAHTYSSAGNYTVNLTVSNANVTVSRLAMITVFEQPAVLPVANFSSNVTTDYAPLDVQFTDNSLNATGWKWDFGDGATSIEQNPAHTYSTAGNYAINLTVSNANGTASKPATITVLPVYAYVANEGSNTVSLIDTATKKVTDIVPVGIKPNAIAVAPDGTVYVANSGESENPSSISIIDTTTKTVTDTLSAGESGRFAGVAVNPTGTKVYATNSGEGIISIIDTATRKIIEIINVGGNPERIAVSPDGTRIYVVKSDSNTVSIIDTVAKTVIDTVDTDNPWGVAATPDGNEVYVTNGDGVDVSVIDTETNDITDVPVGSPGSQGVAVTPDGKKVYVANYGDVFIIDTATKTVMTVDVGIEPWGVAVTPDGKEVYVTGTNDSSGSVSIIDTATNTVIATVPVGESPKGVAVIKK